jgi:hypothetical protein
VSLKYVLNYEQTFTVFHISIRIIRHLN